MWLWFSAPVPTVRWALGEAKLQPMSKTLDLTSEDLSGEDLSGEDLTGEDLTGEQGDRGKDSRLSCSTSSEVTRGDRDPLILRS
jgi:hypothetical protein